MERYRKQILFRDIGEAGQKQLLQSRITVIGCGALGSVIAQTLTRAGVGHLRIVDRDFVDLSNLQRQVLFDEEDVRQRLPKAIAAQNKLQLVNRGIEIEGIVADVTSENILSLIESSNLVMDGTDNFEVRFLINDAAIEKSIPWIHGGCIASHGQVMTIIPGKTACLRCLMPEIPEPGSAETCDTAGVIAPAVQMVASLQVVDALKILTGQSEQIFPSLTIVDAWEGSIRKIDTRQLNESRTCPCCTGQERLWLNGQQGSQSTVLCGRNSVQFTPSTPMSVTFAELEQRLSSLGNVRNNRFLLIFHPADSQYELTIFQNGRAIISGTEDLSEARAIYTRYIGQ